MTMSGMVGMISSVDGDVVTIMSASGDESAWIKKAIRQVITDEEWEAMTAEYSDDPEESEEDSPSDDPDTSSAIEEKAPETDDPGDES